MTTMNSIVFLRGHNVSLRPLQKEDAATCARWINDPEVRDFLKNFWPITLGDEEQWIEEQGKSKPNGLTLAMVTPDGEHIGNMGISRIDWRNRVGTTGAIIGKKELWGKGLGTEAKILLLHHAFNSMNLRKICSQVIVYNERSRKYSEKCGYKVEGVFKDHVFRRGQYWDVINLAVFREGFEPVWEKYEKEKLNHI
jgi:RimJ/RimL family protein N-acetyltransferase